MTIKALCHHQSRNKRNTSRQTPIPEPHHRGIDPGIDPIYRERRAPTRTGSLVFHSALITAREGGAGTSSGEAVRE